MRAGMRNRKFPWSGLSQHNSMWGLSRVYSHMHAADIDNVDYVVYNIYDVGQLAKL